MRAFSHRRLPSAANRGRVDRLGWSLVLGLAGCPASHGTTMPEPEAAAALNGWHYNVEVSEDASHLAVTLCFVGRPPATLVPTHIAAAPYIDNPRVAEGPALAVRRGRIGLDALGPEDCVAYDIDLSEMARLERGSRRSRVVGPSTLVRSSMWLWRPGRIGEGTNISLTLELPEGVDASVPWPVVEGRRGDRRVTYRLDPTVYRWLGYTVFGHPNIQRFEAADAQIELTVLDANMNASDEGLRAWATDAARSVAMLYEGFPRDHLQVVVVPVDGGGGTIYFGAAARGGGSAVYILMDRSAEDEELPGGWTTVHEFLHHGMPFVEDVWMAEGWVSYYTEIMRTRMGHRSEATGWQKLHDAFVRGRQDARGLTMRETSDRMHDTHAYQRVYWSGGAVAFLTDIAMREDSNGKLSLDDAARELRRCCGDAAHKWTAEQLLERLDAWYGKPLFSRIANEHLGKTEFPAVEEGFEALGVRVVDGNVVLDDTHPAANIRRDIMAPRQ